MSNDATRAPRHHVMVDFPQYRKREWVVLEEDHEKALAAKDAEHEHIQKHLEQQIDILRIDLSAARALLGKDGE